VPVEDKEEGRVAIFCTEHVDRSIVIQSVVITFSI
jgi:hypothetical protein